MVELADARDSKSRVRKEEYRQLQSLIDEELASGSEYAAPIHGSYRQSVQLSDVDGDGADEALAFFRDAAKNPKINIYDSENGEHRLGRQRDRTQDRRS